MGTCLIAVAFTAIVWEPPASASLPPAPLQQLTDPPTIIVEASLGQADSTCNYEVWPQGIGTLDGENVQIELSVPSGVTVEGWSCSGTRCIERVSAEDIAETGYVSLTMEIDNGNPHQLGGARIVVAELDPEAIPPECFTKHSGGSLSTYVWCADELVSIGGLECCACPCDFAPSCD